jgi:hypothetical protein
MKKKNLTRTKAGKDGIQAANPTGAGEKKNPCRKCDLDIEV